MVRSKSLQPKRKLNSALADGRRPGAAAAAPTPPVTSGGCSSSGSDDDVPPISKRRKRPRKKVPGLHRDILDVGFSPSGWEKDLRDGGSLVAMRRFPLTPLRSSDTVLAGMKLCTYSDSATETGQLKLIVEKMIGQRLDDDDGEDDGDTVPTKTSDRSGSLAVTVHGKDLLPHNYILRLGRHGLDKDAVLGIAALFKANLACLLVMESVTEVATLSVAFALLPGAFTVVAPTSIPPISRPAVRQLRKLLGTLFPQELLPWSGDSDQTAPVSSPTNIYAAFETRRMGDAALQESLRKGAAGGAAEAAQAGLVPTMRPYQQAAVEWMVARESGRGATTPVVALSRALGWVELPLALPSGARVALSYNALTGCVAWAAPEEPAAVPLGGILADEMGLGKTVEVLALILSNPRPRPGLAPPTSPPPRSGRSSVAASPSTPSSIPGSAYWNDLSPKNAHNSELGDSCICGKCIPADENRSVICSRCGWRLHPECARLSMGHGEQQLVLPHTCVACAVAQSSTGGTGGGPIAARTTLIVCPTPLLQQWQLEVGRHVLAGALSVAVYPGVNELQRTGRTAGGLGLALLRPSVLAKHDVIITTFDVLRGELHHSGGGASSGSSPGSGKSMRFSKRYKVVPSPLTSLHWWRIALDEAQMVETSTADAARMALLLPAHHRWCVSGTPLGKGQLDDLFGLLVFLRALPFDNRSVWNHAVRRPVESQSAGAMHRLVEIIAPLWWRTVKVAVQDQLNLPPQSEMERKLRFSSIERHFYLKQHADTKAHALKLLRRSGTGGDGAWLARLALPLLKLRQACCHPQVGTNGLRGQVGSSGGVMTMSQILDSLIDDARVQGEEAQRGVVMTMNGLAAVARMRSEIAACEIPRATLLAEAASHYRTVLTLAQENRVPIPVTGSMDITGPASLQSIARQTTAGEPFTLIWEREARGPVWARLELAHKKRLVQLRARSSAEVSVSLQAGSHSEGRDFDEVAFFPVKAGAEWADWAPVKDSAVARAHTWRVMVKPLAEGSVEGTESTNSLSVEVELREAMVDADMLQLMHCFHNLAQVQLHRIEDQQRADGVSMEDEGSASHSFLEVEDLKARTSEARAGYLTSYRAEHQYAKSKLENAVSAYERVTAHDRSKTAWWDTALQLMESELSDAMQDAHVAEAEAILEDSPVGGSPEEQGGVHLPFPAFRTLAGLRAGLALELERLQGSRADVLKRLIALSLTPSAQEIAENSSCGDCRKDWGATGATCRHCKLDENLKEWENLLRVLKVHGNVAAKALVRVEAPLVKLLRLVLHWSKKMSGTIWAPIIEEGSSDLGAVGPWELMQREVVAGKKVHKAYADLLSGIDELSSATQITRLALPDEDLSQLTEDQRKLVALPFELDAIREDHVALKIGYEQQLSEAKHQLMYLSNVWYDNHGAAASRICAVCLETLGSEVSVAGCGHSFHFECCKMLLGHRQGHDFCCPTCRRATPRSSISTAAYESLSSADGSQACVKVLGSWGTKVQALVGDILSLPDGEKALVFSEWEEMLSIVESALKANEVVCGRIRGNRDFCTLLPRFREGVDGMRVLLLPLKKGAEGLNLVEATHIFLLEPVLNAAAEAQAINRVHRIGQTRPTTVHRLLVVDTIEEGIRDLQAKRAVAAGGADALLLTDAAVAKRSSGYTRDDIVTLFDDDEVRTEEKEASE